MMKKHTNYLKIEQGYGFIYYDDNLNSWIIRIIGGETSIPIRVKEKDANVAAKTFLKLLTELSRHKKRLKSFTLYVCNLNKFMNYLIDNRLSFNTFTIKTFKPIDKHYSTIVISLYVINKSLVLKDYYNFIPFHNEETSVDDKINLLNILIKIIFENYKINLNHKRIVTLTSIAMKIFAKISPHKKTLIKKLNNKIDTFIRKSFFGGRAEIFIPYIKENLYYYDVNALYPFIMKNYKLPIGKAKYIPGNDIDLSSFYGFIHVLVTCENMQIPVLPVRLQKDFPEVGVIYPNGTFKGVFFSEELKVALNNGYKILKIFEGYMFKSEIIFDSFMDNLFSLKQTTHNNDMKKLIKLLMNSVYGKYAGVYSTPIPFENGEREVISRKYFNVGISSAITANARCYMFNIIKPYTNDLIYWDTDGIILKRTLPALYIDNTLLGKFKLVSEINEFAAVATKFYLYTNTINNNFTYIFRGITSNKYTINGNKVYILFKKIINSNIDKKTTVDIYFELKNKKSNLPEIFQFSFGNKRCFYLKENIIISRPWNVLLEQNIINKKHD